WKIFHLPRVRVTLELCVDVFDENLAADLFAKKADVAADDRAEIDERRRFAPRQCREEFSQRFGREERFVGGHVNRRTNLRLCSTLPDSIEKTQGVRAEIKNDEFRIKNDWNQELRIVRDS